MANPTGTIRVRVSFKRSFSWLQTWLQVREAAKSRSHLKVSLTALTIVGHFYDEGGLFTDNIFRFTQAASEVSALLGCISSAIGY